MHDNFPISSKLHDVDSFKKLDFAAIEAVMSYDSVDCLVSKNILFSI